MKKIFFGFIISLIGFSCSGQNNNGEFKTQYTSPIIDSSNKGEIKRTIDLDDTSSVIIVITRGEKNLVKKGKHFTLKSSVDEISNYILDRQKESSRILFVFDDMFDYAQIRSYMDSFEKIRKKETRYYMMKESQL